MAVIMELLQALGELEFVKTQALPWVAGSETPPNLSTQQQQQLQLQK